MCGRYYIPDENGFADIGEMMRQLKIFYKDSPLLSQMKQGEIFPTDIVPAITNTAPQLMKWGFEGFGGKGLIINARAETVSEKPMFRKQFAAQRCLLPAANYFEWKKDGTKKQKYSIRQKEPIYMAGLYQLDEISQLPLFVILTRAASTELSFLHDRMPVILPRDMREKWLDCKINAQELMNIPEGKFEYESVG
jgi:putative SOS response-associated peptidase YedK